jgi:hypothetical protein
MTVTNSGVDGNDVPHIPNGVSLRTLLSLLSLGLYSAREGYLGGRIGERNEQAVDGGGAYLTDESSSMNVTEGSKVEMNRAVSIIKAASFYDHLIFLPCVSSRAARGKRWVLF